MRISDWSSDVCASDLSDPVYQTDATRRFEADPEAKAALAATRQLSEISPKEFDAVFYPGGHCTLWVLAADPTSISLIRSEERRVGTACVNTCSSRWSPDLVKNTICQITFNPHP